MFFLLTKMFWQIKVPHSFAAHKSDVIVETQQHLWCPLRVRSHSCATPPERVARHATLPPMSVFQCQLSSWAASEKYQATISSSLRIFSSLLVAKVWDILSGESWAHRLRPGLPEKSDRWIIQTTIGKEKDSYLQNKHLVVEDNKQKLRKQLPCIFLGWHHTWTMRNQNAASCHYSCRLQKGKATEKRYTRFNCARPCVPPHLGKGTQLENKFSHWIKSILCTLPTKKDILAALDCWVLESLCNSQQNETEVTANHNTFFCFQTPTVSHFNSVTEKFSENLHPILDIHP